MRLLAEHPDSAAADRLADAVAASGMTPEIVDARVFDREVPLGPDSVQAQLAARGIKAERR